MNNLKKLSKRGLALFLALTLCVSVLSVAAFAEDGAEMTEKEPVSGEASGSKTTPETADDAADGDAADDDAAADDVTADAGDDTADEAETDGEDESIAGIQRVSRKVRAAAEISGTMTGEQLLEAADDGVITLDGNVYLTSTATIADGQTVTLDLYGHVITVPQTNGRSLYAIDNYGTMTITDSSQTGEGKIIARGVENYGKMSMLGGTIESCDSNGGGAAIWNEGDFEMTGGTLAFTGQKSGNSAGCPFTNAKAEAVANITGGALLSPLSCMFVNAGTVTVENISVENSTSYWMAFKVFDDGTLNLENVTVNSKDGGCIECAGGIVNLTNCTFTQGPMTAVPGEGHTSSAVSASNGGTVNVHSGSYTSAGYGAYVFSSGGTINIEGAETVIQGDNAAVKADTASDGEPANVTIKDAKVTGQFQVSQNGGVPVNISIESGTFDTDVSSYLAPTAVAEVAEAGGTTVRARTETDEDAVAKVGDDVYASLQAAIAAAQNDDTVTLLQDIPNSSRVTITKSVKIDLNQKSIGGGDQFATIMINSKNADVKIENGSLSDTNAARGTVYVQRGAVTLENVTVNASVRGVGIGPGAKGYYGKATLNNGTTITATESGVGIFGPNDGTTTPCELIVNEGVVITSQLYGIAGNGSNDDTVITINGGTVTATGGYSTAPDYSAGIYHPQQGTLNINGGEISGKVGVQMAGGTAVIKGGTLHSTDTDIVASPYKAAQQGDGMVLDGAALSLVSRSAYGDLHVTVEDGSFTTANPANEAVKKYGMKKTTDAWEVIDEPTTSKLAVSGGTFSSDVNNYVVEGSQAVQQDTDGVWTIAPAADSVAAIGNKGYKTLQVAIAAAKNTETVKLLNNATIAKYIAIQGKSITLDLNGKTASGGYLWVYGDNAGLIIEDSSTAQTGKIDGTTYGLRVSGGNGTATVNSGTVSGNTYGVLVQSGTVTVAGGTVKGSQCAALLTDGTVNVDDGLVSGGKTGISTNYSKTAASKKTIVISGGKVESTCQKPEGPVAGTTYATSAAVDAMYGATVTVGGSAILKGGFSGVSVWDNGTTFTMNGGTVTGDTYGVTGNGSGDTNNTINLNAGAVHGEVGVYHPQGGVLNIGAASDHTGPTITGSQVGVQMCAGEALNIYGGTIEAQGEDNRASKESSSGVIFDGAAVSVIDRNYPSGGPTSVNISGGDLKSAIADGAILAYTWSEQDDGKYAATDWTNTSEDESQRIVVSGGTFSSEVLKAYCAPDYWPTTQDGTYTVVYHPAGGEHSWDEGVVTKPASCTEDGEKMVTCTVCGKTETEVISALGHNTDGVVEHRNATCTEDGVVGGTYCTRCEYDKATAEAVIPALGHNADGVVAHRDATCTEDGVVGGTYCTNCGNGRTTAETVIPALGHNTDGVVEHRDATCTETGVVGGTYCTHCGNGRATAEAVIPVIDHTPVTDPAVEATLTMLGKTAGSHCGVCGTVLVAQTDVKFQPTVAITSNRATLSGSGTVTLTVTATEGAAVTVTCDNADINVTRNEDGTYSAALPNTTATYTFTAAIAETETANAVSAAVTVDVTRYAGGGGGGGGSSSGGTTTTPPAVEIDEPDVPLAELPLPFVDVENDDWFREAVAYVYSGDLMKGTAETTFSPAGDTNRGMIVTMLHRLEKTPEAASANFSDILAGQWYQEAVDWGAAVGVVKGYSDGRYGPEDHVTREQLVAILYRYAQLKGCDVSARADLSRFTDAGEVSAYAVDAMSWAVSVGLVEGTSETTLSPSGNATRAQVAAITMRLCENVLPKA